MAHSRPSTNPSPHALFDGPGPARAAARGVGWSATGLGAIEGWPEALRCAVRMCLASPTAIAIWGGLEFTLVHNDAYGEILGERASSAMGRRAAEVWPELWSGFEPEFTRVLRTGAPVNRVDQPFVLRRAGRDEEAFFTFSLSPIRDESGRAVGLLNVVLETSSAVAALRRKEREVRDGEAHSRRQLAELQTIYDSAHVGLCVFDRDLRFLRINRRLAEINGVPASEHVGRTVEEVVPALAPSAREIRDRIVRTGAPVTDVEFSGTTASMPGVRRTWIEQWLPLKDVSGEVTAINVVVEEVTERRRAERVLAENERRFAVMFRRSPVAMAWIRLPEGLLDDVNDAWLELTGVPREEALGKTASALGLLPDHERRRYYDALLAHGRAAAEVALASRRKGPRTCQVQAEVVTLGDERFMLAVLQDVTDLRRAERALRESEERLSLALEAAQVGIWEYDPRALTVEWSPLCRKLLGVAEDGPVAYERFLEAVHPEDRARTQEAVARALEPRGDGVYSAEYRVRWPDGTRHWISAFGRTQFTGDGGERRPALMRGAVVDVTPAKDAELAAREADRRKTEFLAVLSHELRNPLASIRNAILLLDGAPPGGATATRAVDTLRRQTEHLVRLVDDLLDLSRITHGKVEVKLAPADLRELARRAWLDAKGLFEARDVELRFAEPPEPLWAQADAARFSQMVGNLLHNALKFTPPGGCVELAAARRGAACEVRVKDSGQGLEAGELDRIFDPFRQALRPSVGGGLGLGLALVKGLAEKHGGSVRAHSAGPGLGAEFVITLPLATAPPVQTGRPRHGPGPDATLSIVIVEDNEDAAATLAELLALGGHRVATAATGADGLDAVAAQRPDVLICDLGLPDMSGHDVIRAIRAREGGARVFATALSGYAQPQDRDAALAAGFDAHLPKPPPLDELEALLARAGRRRASG